MNRRKFLTLTAAIPITACGSNIDTAVWTEEVKLHDGRIIQVWRQARAMHGGFPNSDRGRDIDFELRYDAMQVSWKGPWNRPPTSFEIFDGVPHLVLSILDPASCASKAPTDYAAQFFRHVDGRWKEISQSEFPSEQALVNLYDGYWGGTPEEDASGLVTWQAKAECRRSMNISLFRIGHPLQPFNPSNSTKSLICLTVKSSFTSGAVRPMER